MCTPHFPLHERFHDSLCFRVEQYLMWLWSWCVLGLTDHIRSLRQVTSHVTVETEVDPNLPPHSSGAKQTDSNRMVGWAQDTQKSTLIPKMMKSSRVSVNTLAHYSCSFQVSPHQTPMVSKAHKCACLSTNCEKKESARCQTSCHSSSEKFKSFTTELWFEFLEV